MQKRFVSSPKHTPALPASPGMSTAAAVKAEQIRTLYGQSVGIMFVNPLNAAIVAAVLWSYSSAELLAAWVAAMFAATTGRAILRRRYLSASPPPEETHVWARHFVIGASVTGLLWGVGGALLYSPSALAPQLLLIFAIGGMIAGASGVLALHLPAFIGFAACAISPVAVRMLAEGDTLNVAMGILAIVYGVAMVLVAANTNRAVAETFRLRFENHDLLDRLSRAQVSLAEANRTLEERVAERGAALERQTEALREAQRMESLGLLAGGVAHDFNNLLTVVLGNAELLRLDSKLSKEDRVAIEEIHRAAHRGSALVSQLLAFSRRQVMVQRVLDLNAVLSEAQRLLGRLLGAHIDLEVVTHIAPLPVRADPTQLQQVIINLATNARDAMPMGGKLMLATELMEGAIPESNIPPGKYAVLSVRDTGVGMDAETKRMAFYPFFTTKEVGSGTGLGLATVYGIVEQSGGHVVLDSEPGRGSWFRIFLSCVAMEELETLAAKPAPAASPAPRGATILIAEDEMSVRAIAARTLRAAGFTILEAENGEQALHAARRYAGPIDLLVSDVVMPKMGGVELARRMASERPAMRTLFMSGYSGNDIPSMTDPSIVFLQKPFTPTQLLDGVSKLLASPRPPSAGRK